MRQTRHKARSAAPGPSAPRSEVEWSEKPIRIGTRGSRLALWQAGAVRDALAAAHGLGDGAIEIVPIKTSGDLIRDRPLSEAGGKGLFSKEIEAAS